MQFIFSGKLPAVLEADSERLFDKQIFSKNNFSRHCISGPIHSSGPVLASLRFDQNMLGHSYERSLENPNFYLNDKR